MNATRKLQSSILVTALGLGAFLTACGDDTTGSGGSGGGGGSSASSSKASSTGASSTSGSTASSSSGGSVAPKLAVINTPAFDPAKNELPVGLAVTDDGKTAYVGYGATGQVVKVSLPDGAVSAFGSVPKPPTKTSGRVLDLAVDSAGAVYVGVAAFFPATMYKSGIFKIPKAGDAETMAFAADPQMTFPSGLTFDTASPQSLWVADSNSGSILKVAADGTVSRWKADDLLKGDASPTNPCRVDLIRPIGASGIIVTATEVIVANTDKASLVKIPINADGTAGDAAVLVKSDATTCLPLKGAAGIALDKDGNILVAATVQNALLKVTKDGAMTTTLIDKDKLDFPVNIVFLKDTNQALFTNAATVSAGMSGGMPQPSLAVYGPLP